MSDDVKKFILEREEFRKSRIPSLYSEFSTLRELNPEGFDANIDAWSNLLTALAMSNFGDSKVSITTYPDICQFLSLPDHGKPLGMKVILQELVHQKKFVPLSIYERSEEIYSKMCNISNKFSDYLSPKIWVEWALGSVRFGGGFTVCDNKGKLVNERYICWDAFLELGSKYYDEINSYINKEGHYSSKLHNKQSLYNLLSNKFNARMVDIEILLILWSRDMKLCQILKKDLETYIKFNNDPITELDIAIINIQSSINKLENRTNLLENKIKDLDLKIKLSVREKAFENDYIKKLMILKKAFNKSLLDLMGSLHQLNVILGSINDANANNEIFSQLASSSKILSEVNSKISLDDIENLKMDIDDQINTTSIISDCLAGFDRDTDEEIEIELDALAQEAKRPSPKSIEQEGDSEDVNDELIDKLKSLNVKNNDIETSHELAILEGESGS